LRPIEDFWGILKQKVYEKGWGVKSINQLKKNISESLKKLIRRSPLSLPIPSLQESINVVDMDTIS